MPPLISREEALALGEIEDHAAIEELVERAWRARTDHFGDSTDLCSLVNAKSGGCAEDCGFCAQSKYAEADTPMHAMMSPDQILEHARAAEAAGAHRFCMVTQGQGLSKRDFENIVEGAKLVAQHTNLKRCASIGHMSATRAKALKDAGIQRVHHNVETAESYYDEVSTTVRYEGRIRTVEAVKEAGLTRRVTHPDPVDEEEPDQDDRGDEEHPPDRGVLDDHPPPVVGEVDPERDEDAEDAAERAALAQVEPGAVDLHDRHRAEALEVHVQREERGEHGRLVLDEDLPLDHGAHEEVRERGAGLSVGQKQLISFARALAFDPALLILDEATSSIDTETEQLIQQAIARVMRSRTSVIVAHRLSTIQRADNIIVLHHGEIREQGTHQDLLTLRGLYWRLYKLQYADPTWQTETKEEEQEEQVVYRPRSPGFSFGEGMG